MELKERQNKIIENQAELDKLQKAKDAYYEAKTQQEKTRLEHEREELERSHQCINCGNLLPETMKTHKFPKGIVCNACFLTALGTDIKKWS